MKVAITGSTGMIGTRLTRSLRAEGHAVTRIVRSYSGLPHGERGIVWHPEQGVIEAGRLEAHDLVIHLAAESLAGVWTPAKKRRIRESRAQGTTLLAKTLASLDAPPRVLFSASAVGIYGDRPDEPVLDENSTVGTGFLADVGRIWEDSTRPAAEAGVRVINTRFGLVMSARGGVLPVLLPMFRLGLGAALGDGRQYWPWIAIDDIPAAMLHAARDETISGPVNFVAPQQVTNEEFTEELAAVAGRRSLLKVPAFAAKIAPGGMAEELLLSSARVVPRKLLDSGFTFRYPELKPALHALLKQ